MNVTRHGTNDAALLNSIAPFTLDRAVAGVIGLDLGDVVRRMDSGEIGVIVGFAYGTFNREWEFPIVRFALTATESIDRVISWVENIANDDAKLDAVQAARTSAERDQ